MPGLLGLNNTVCLHFKGSDHPYKVNYTDSSGSNYIAYINICEELNIPCPDEDHQRNIAVCQLQNKTGHSMGSIHEKQLRSVLLGQM